MSLRKCEYICWIKPIVHPLKGQHLIIEGNLLIGMICINPKF